MSSRKDHAAATAIEFGAIGGLGAWLIFVLPALAPGIWAGEMLPLMAFGLPPMAGFVWADKHISKRRGEPGFWRNLERRKKARKAHGQRPETTCQVCGQQIKFGQELVERVNAGPWQHVECPPEDEAR